jgi:hypothetical protein
VRVRSRRIVSLLATAVAGVAAAVALGSAGGPASTAGAATTAQTVTLGSTTGDPTANICFAMINCTYAPFSGVNAPALQVPFDGTVTSFSINSGSAGNTVELRVLRPVGGGRFTGAGTSRPQMLPGGPATFTVSLPVKAGDILGIDNSDSAIMFDTTTPNAITAYYQPALADGATAAPNQTASGDRLLLSAVVVQTTTTSGTTTTNPGTPTPIPATLRVTQTSAVSGSVASFGLTCDGSAGQSCAGTVVGTVRETKKGGTVVAVTARTTAANGQKHKTTPKRVTVTVARASYSLATGSTGTLRVALNAQGQQLLKRFHTLSVRLAFTGTLTTTETAVFGELRTTTQRVNVGIPADRWFHINLPCSNCYTMAQRVPISGIPKGARVTVSCKGAGCPFGRRAVAPHHGRADVASLLGSSHLQPRTVVKVAISAPRKTGETIVYTMQRGAGPVRTIQ